MSNLRTDGKADEKALYKLMSNAVYGKAMENMRNKTDLKLISNTKVYLKWTAKLCMFYV